LSRNKSVKRRDEDRIVKRATFVLAAGCWAFAAGCGSNNRPPSYTDPAVKDFPKMGKGLQKLPEYQLKTMKAPQQQVEYLHRLEKDSAFDPKQHVPMLEEYSTNSDPDVAAAAKGLLDRAK